MTNTEARTAEQIATEVGTAMEYGVNVVGRDVIAPDNLVTTARDLAVTFGAHDTTARPSALLGYYVVTVWME